MTKLATVGTIALMFGASSGWADPAGVLLDQVAALQNTEVQEVNGFLFRGWLQMDEDNPVFVVYVGDRRYDVVLDDGRGTSQKAASCQEENLFDENPSAGCSITFDAEYLVEDNGGTIAVSMKAWNVNFQ